MRGGSKTEKQLGNERKRTEEALHEQIVRNELILRTAMDGFCVADKEGSILEVNDAFAVISGYSREELIAMNIRDLEAEENSQEVTEHIRRVMKDGSDRFETRHRRKDGQIVDLEVSANFVKTKNGRFFVAFFHEITEEKREHRLRLEREKELEIKTRNLEEVNTALKVLLKRREEDKTELEERVQFNVNQLVMPYVEKLRKTGLNERQNAHLNVLELNLNEMISRFQGYHPPNLYMKLTAAEREVANLVRHGKTSKEIAEILNVSAQTIDFHRQNIREKIGIRNKKANLRTHLLFVKGE